MIGWESFLQQNSSKVHFCNSEMKFFLEKYYDMKFIAAFPVAYIVCCAESTYRGLVSAVGYLVLYVVEIKMSL